MDPHVVARVAPDSAGAPSEPAPVRHRDPVGAGLRAARARQGVDLPVWAHRAGAAAHRAHPRSGSTSTSCAAGWCIAATQVDASIRNVTDIDDKILAKSAEAGEPWWALAVPQRARGPRRRTTALGCLPPTYEPRATGHVPEMIELMQRLIDAGHAYAADGDVYFDVRSFPAYGALSGQKLDEMQPAGDSRGRRRASATRATSRCGRRPSRRAEPRPGRRRGAAAGPAGTSSARRWPPSTSARRSTSTAAGWTWSSRTTRTRSPSRSRPATASPGTGCTTAWLTIGGEKMSKSLGNSLLVDRDRQAQWRPVEVRYYLGAAHYRSTIEYSPRRWTRRPRRTGGSRTSSSGRRESSRRLGDTAPVPRRVRRGDGRRPGRAGRARRRARRRCARATPRWPTATSDAAAAALRRGAGDDRRARHQPGRVGAARRRPSSRRRSTRWSRSRSSSARRPGPARTSRRPTRSATSSAQAGVVVEDTAVRSALDAEGPLTWRAIRSVRARYASRRRARRSGRVGRASRRCAGKRSDAAGRGPHRASGRPAGRGGRPASSSRGTPLRDRAPPTCGAARRAQPGRRGATRPGAGHRAVRRDRYRGRRTDHRGGAPGG